MGNDIEGDLLGKLLRRRLVGHKDALGLVPQLVEAFLAGAGNGLIGGHHHALDPGHVMQGLEGDHKLGRRAIGIGDDVAAVVAGHVLDQRMGVHFRNDERHFRVIAPAGGIIDDDGAHRADLRRPFLGDGGARRHQHEIDLGKVELLEILALEGLVAEGDLNAHGFARGDGEALIDREFALGEDVEHFAAHIARGADDCNLVTHGSLLDLVSGPPALEPLCGSAFGIGGSGHHPPRAMRPGEEAKRFF